MPSREDRVRDYLKLITASLGGVEAVHARLNELGLAGSAGGIEAAGPGGKPVFHEAQAGLETIERGRDLSESQAAGIEAIIIPQLRPVFDVVGDTFEATHELWTKLNGEKTKKRLGAAIPAIGRIEVTGAGVPYGGTGFVVGKGLVMTNRHVAEIFARGAGTRASFISGRRAGIDFLRERDSSRRLFFRAPRVRMIHPYWDMALLEVDDLPADHPVLHLAVEDARDMTGREVVVVGYPAFDSRNPADVQTDLFDGAWGVKRLQPGLLQGGFRTESFRKIVPAATHDCSTLGGNSGSAVISVKTGEVVALHFGGRYEERNYAVPTGALARDSRVVDAGVSFAGEPPGDPNDWASWWRRADRDDDETASEEDEDRGGAPVSGVSGGSPISGGGGRSFVVPLRITVSIDGTDGANVVSIGETAATTEAMREPWHDDSSLGDRTGYDDQFLSGATELPPVEVPMPTVRDPDILARTRNGSDVLHYQTFSLMMHARRRLAVVTACNVTREDTLRRPEPGRDYTRKGLSGLGKNDQEKWFADPRLEEKFQLPDIFFTKDDKAFDKGHLVRREDAAWGPTYDLLRRANGDTYYVTNCSPQVKGFNQSQHGEINWGDLENHVFAQAASERLCVFAGPVLSDDDGVFQGRGAGGTVIRARIPGAFWKVIVARALEGIQAYGFVLEQDLDAVPLEFTVAPDFVPVMKPLATIEKMTGVVFAPSLHDADQFETVQGIELALRAGATQQH